MNETLINARSEGECIMNKRVIKPLLVYAWDLGKIPNMAVTGPNRYMEPKRWLVVPRVTISSSLCGQQVRVFVSKTRTESL